MARNQLHAEFGKVELTAPRPDHLSLAGDHGARNALAAMAATLAYGVPPEIVLAGLSTFAGVENRLETVATIGGVTWVNDTSATAPVAAVAGVDVLAPRARALHVIAGGADKRIDLSPFADALKQAGAIAYLLEGSATPGLLAMLEERGVMVSGTFGSILAAVEAAAGAAVEGDIVALCPACASFGMFRNEFDRGAKFRAAVMSMTDERGQVS
jgi:UDP-N-acetylmuramoylalanine--D-glutamate ligase